MPTSLRRRLGESLRAFAAVFRNEDLRRLELAWSGSIIGQWGYEVALAVFAYRAGGALETVIENVTGVFFDQQNGHSLAEAIENFEGLHWRQDALRHHAEGFDKNVFAFRVLQFLGSVAPASCADELLTGARLLSHNLSKRVWPRLALTG